MRSTTVRNNLLNDANYKPYCGNFKCNTMPRAEKIGLCVYKCPSCGWVSNLSELFINHFVEHHGGNKCPKLHPTVDNLDDVTYNVFSVDMRCGGVTPCDVTYENIVKDLAETTDKAGKVTKNQLINLIRSGWVFTDNYECKYVFLRRCKNEPLHFELFNRRRKPISFKELAG